MKIQSWQGRCQMGRGGRSGEEGIDRVQGGSAGGIGRSALYSIVY
jgi:hypothetical protein